MENSTKILIIGSIITISIFGLWYVSMNKDKLFLSLVGHK